MHAINDGVLQSEDLNENILLGLVDFWTDFMNLIRFGT